MKTYPVLYSFRRCPFAIRARLALIVNNIQCEVREILLKDKPSAMLSLSPKGTVPVFTLADQVIDESIDIMVWAYSESSNQNGLPQESEWSLIKTTEEGFKFHLDRYKYDAYHDPSQRLNHRQSALNILKGIEPALITSIGHEASLTFTDYAILPLIRQYRSADQEWFENAEELSWYRARLNKLLTSEVFIAAMQKYPLWSAASNGEPNYLL